MKSEVNLRRAKRNGKLIKLGTKTDLGIIKFKKNEFQKLDNKVIYKKIQEKCHLRSKEHFTGQLRLFCTFSGEVC